MSWQGFLELLALGATVPRLGRYFADVYGVRADGSAPGDRVFKPIERFVYRICGVDDKGEQRWNVYALSLLAFSLVSLLALYALQRAQGVLPFNPTDRTSVTPWGSFNTAVSFVTNTNWQWYSGEVTMSHLTQMIGLTVQNFVSAAAGMAVVVAMIRGITRTGTRVLGNFWVDLTRSVGSLVEQDGVVVGSSLIGQQFSDPKYFWPRPSVAGAGYDPTASSGSNLGPTNADLLAAVAERVAQYRAANGLDDAVLVPVDAVTASASGLDPQISVANATLQAPRVAKSRDMAVDQVLALVRDNTDHRPLGFLGDQGVNVLKLNLALDNVEG